MAALGLGGYGSDDEEEEEQQQQTIEQQQKQLQTQRRSLEGNGAGESRLDLVRCLGLCI
jgi:hypothetical protein